MPPKPKICSFHCTFQFPNQKCVLLPGGKLPGTPNQEAHWVWVQNVSTLAYCDYKIEKTKHFSASTGCSKAQRFSASGGLRPPDPPNRGSAPGPRWGLRPQTPVIGSRSTRSPCAPQSQFLDPPLKGRGNLAPTVISKSRRLCLQIISDCHWHSQSVSQSVNQSEFIYTAPSQVSQRCVWHRLGRVFTPTVGNVEEFYFLKYA